MVCQCSKVKFSLIPPPPHFFSNCSHNKRGIIKENWGCYWLLTPSVTLHALPNQVIISPRLIRTAVMTRLRMTLYRPLICFLSAEQENVIPHIPERSLCSLRMTFNLSLHQSTSGRERNGGTREGG